MKSIPTPDEFREYLWQLSEAEFSRWEDDELITKCLQQGSPYQEIWDDYKDVNDALSSLTVPEPKRSIATSVMASIAAESIESKEKSESKGFKARVIELVQWEFKVPVWAVACLLLLLAGSVSINFQINREADALQQQYLAAIKQESDQVQPFPSIQVIPQPNGIVPVANRGGAPFPLNASPTMIIIMGAPPSSWMSDLLRAEQPTTRRSLDFSENVI